MPQTLPDWSQLLARHDITVDEILRLQDLGVISEDDNFELVEG